MKIANMLSKREKTKIKLICVLMCVSSIVCMVPVVFTQGYVDTIVDETSSIKLALIFGACYLLIELVQTGLSAWSNYILDKTQIAIGGELQKRLFEKYIHIDYAHIINIDSSNLTNILLEDIALISSKYLIPVTKIITAICQFVFGVVYLVKVHYVLAFITIPLGAITALMNAFTESKYLKNAVDKKNISQGLWKSFSEIFRGIVPIRIYQLTSYFKGKVETQVSNYVNASNNQNRLEKINEFVASFLYMFVIGMIMIVTGLLVYKGELSIGSMVAVMMFNHMVVDPLITILETRKTASELKVSEKRLMDVFTIDTNNIEESRVVVDEIKIVNLSFNYENNGEKKVLDKFDLHIKPNEHIAIMGETGSGKSTLCKLIAGLQENAGAISYYKAGVKVEALPTISYLYQNSYVFDDTVENNVRLSNAIASDEEVLEAMKVSLLDEVIKVHGKNTVGENGDKLSGGEKMRVRLAQALLKSDSSIFIFDELSSSLDDETFVAIMQNIKLRLQEKIVIFVEHNNLIKDYVDRVVMIEG